LVLAKGTGPVDSNPESFIWSSLLVTLTSTNDGAPSKTQQSVLLGLNPVTGWWWLTKAVKKGKEIEEGQEDSFSICPKYKKQILGKTWNIDCRPSFCESNANCQQHSDHKWCTCSKITSWNFHSRNA
jgi:hypothetical protein